MKKTLILVVVVLSTATLAFGAKPDADRFKDLLRKAGVSDVDKTSKSLCVCKDGTAQDGHAGKVRYEEVTSGAVTYFRVHCVTQDFNADRSKAAEHNCDTFTVLK